MPFRLPTPVLLLLIGFVFVILCGLGAWQVERGIWKANLVARYGRKGENIVQPLIIAPGEAVLVDRGWYPEGQRDAALKRLATFTGPTPGLARYAEGIRASKTPAGTWTGLAPDSMSAGLPYRVLPWFVTEGQLTEGGDYSSMPTTYPVQGYQRYVSTVSHTEYALTWFGIAAALVAIAVARLVIAPRRARRGAAREG